MTHFAFKISGISVLLCGLVAPPQAQIRTGISSRGAEETNTPGKVVTNNQPQPPATAQVSGRRRPKPTPVVQETPAPVVAPPVQQVQQPQAPLRPEQMPPSPPKVGYENGLLSVEATNSTLGDILNMIRTKAGIQFDGLQVQNAPDRVATKLGPAPADTVLTALLRGSHFDYLILGRVDRPDVVQRVILTPSSSAGLAANTATAGIQPIQARPGMVLVQPIEDDEGVVQEEQAGVPQPQIQPMQQPGVQQPVQQSGNGQRQGNPTSEQLLEELKQMQQQQQQNPNQQNMQPPPPLKPRIPQ